ncbi:MAG: lytic transglycosylase domain-containing protein [Rhodobacteraceae bacterium]|nr:lytic transglycosylase domain-containing protein [Paracoccaceae bacterium]
MATVRPAAAFAPPGGDPPSLCLAAAQRASRATGVPLEVLQAISLTESGRRTEGRFAPWPWTLNIAGKGYFFQTRQEALARARSTLAGGQTSFDLGCFQVNFRWHGDAFASLDDMLDPDRNALYAARFLSGLYAETGNWSAAAGYYHSRTPAHADGYRQIFDRHLAQLGGGPLTAMAPSPSAPAPEIARTAMRIRENRFPFLQEGEAPRTMGSLVPATEARGGLLDTSARSLWGG